MKSKFLDTRNCHALLPTGHGLSNLQRLDECLHQVNDNNEQFQGLIDKLIEHNKKTSNNKYGSQRLINSTIDIGQGLDIPNRTINTRAYERPYNGPIRLHIILESDDGMSWKSLVPLQFLLKGWGDANSGYQCYVHSIQRNLPRAGAFDQYIKRQSTDSEDDYYYVGITGRNWLHRLSEHMGEMRRGSGRKFYRAWRGSLGFPDVLFISTLMDVNLSEGDAMNWEEHNVDKIAYGPNGLNMIPGGYKGWKLLHTLGVTKKRTFSEEEREKAISEFIQQNPRKGIPNPFISQLWKNDDHYQRVIEARPKTLSRNQVLLIRELSEMGWAIPEITREINALNETQVKNVLSGKTYQRFQ